MDYSPINTLGFAREVVIKVKYGDTLKRFSAQVNGQYLDYDVTKLRTKIINAFKLSPDADLTLTYTDEDGDVVTLDDDDDLRAAVRQQLNPLRITAQMKCNVSADAEPRPRSANPTPSSPNSNIDPAQMSSAVEEALKSLPEPFRTTVSKFSQDIISKAAASSPPLVETLQFLSKLGILNNSQTSDGSMGRSSVNVNVSTEPKDNPVPELSEKQPKTENTPLEIRTDAPQNPGTAGYSPIDDVFSCVSINSNEEHKIGSKAHHNARSDSFIDEALGCHEVPKMPPFPNYISGTDTVGNEKSKQKAVGASSSTLGDGFLPRIDVPFFKGWPLCPPSTGVPRPIAGFSPLEHPFRPNRGVCFPENVVHTFHRGVQCDGCGMNPIVGSRYKSKVKDDYDLCSICFSRMGVEADYTRIDQPFPFPSRMFNHHPKYRYVPHGCGVRQTRGKLEGRFIKDVAVHDGTLMAPSTRFTKIWRMRNNGTIPWPYGTRIMCVGGDHFASQDKVQLQIPLSGFPVDNEIDIAVDFYAPPLPGRYMTYWRLVSPSGQKFGQRVWVLIQVESSESSTSSTKPTWNLNLPPESSGNSVMEMMDANIETKDGTHPQPNMTNNTSEELIKPLVDDTLVKSEENAEPAPVVVPPVQYPIVDFPTSALLPPPPTHAVVPPVQYPIVDFPTSAPPMHAVVPPGQYPTVDFSTLPPPPPPPPPPHAFNYESSVEEALLKELEEMGFKQIDLNKEILRQNKYDLDQSVGDLCGFTEWDPLLIELEEMGFDDKEKNKHLLEKNGGSIKRVVMDLVAEEKSQ